ncbi:urate hydroxylase PuuD [Flavobacterium wongokense]|uniref:urate hydroxylase PuuD n=1 Tax=Flavobacterium wongokense TaxID=2910674 RepID=UPI001F1A2063|nr:urate hydroxylase PuuD [Flavobacterium sp. WG47]
MSISTFVIVVLYVIEFSVLITLGYMSYKMPNFLKGKNQKNPEGDEDIRNTSQNYIYAGILLMVVAILFNTYIVVEGTPLEAHLMEWLNIVIRLMHITFGIAWIGASFYFVFLENALNRTEDVRDELAGNLWAVHGGGFYYLEKYKVAPKVIPKHLHWFKYEAYFTWLSGFCLLFVVYYFNASAFLIDKNVLDITAAEGILLGVGSFVVAWLIYDRMCKSSLIKNQLSFALVGFAFLILFAFFYCHVFSARAAYIHFGAMIGSLMVANVFFVIIPGQKEMVRCAKLGIPLDPSLGKKALARSLHNNYFTLPVLFVMVSNHFPSTFGYEYPWLILAIISLGAAGVKHYLNLKEQKHLNVWILPVSVVILLAACFISAPSTNPYECKKEVTFIEVNEIIQKRCVQCHSSSPTDDVYKTAPNGVKYDTPQDILNKKDLIMQRVVVTKTMPQNNKTNITEEERNMIRCWIEQGASLK